MADMEPSRLCVKPAGERAAVSDGVLKILVGWTNYSSERIMPGMRRKKYSEKPPTVYFRDMEQELRAWMGTFFGDTIIAVMEFGMTVGLELVRHLAIANGAGLAGVTALYSATDTSEKHALLSSAAWFLAGLALAIFTLLILYAAEFFVAKRFTRAVTSWIANTAPFDAEKLLVLRLTAIPTWTMGLVSICCFVVGGIKLILALKIQL